ncbi:MAG: hypothetical protein A3I43_02140 [Omnitrophica WOR_2 bacterium RIFCSPLOWO2_02_FULL_50_19]|nr:MAG: hypothetical protein A3I43_02140 [Omnitrophica WOR_2 bacterium RIFCSPLOWO2_02_FULL_50_19]
MPLSKQKSQWRLNSNHDVEFTVTDTKDLGGGEVITLKADMIGIAPDELTCIITSKKKRDVEVASILKLKGRWQADENNRLSFAVSKEDGTRDVLVFDGIWELGDDNQIMYRYKKTGLVRKTKEERSFVFRGAWRLTGKDKIAYMLDTSGESGFLFKAQLENSGISGRFGVLKYRVGIGLSERKRPVEKVIKFFGVLRLNISKRDSLEFEFTDARGQRLGMSATLSRKLLGGEAFLRFKRLAEESKIEAGIKFPW